MKITLDLPDWTDERNIRVFAGIEPVARRLKDGHWEIKTARCSQCGACCSNLGSGHPFPTIDRQCIYLTPEPGKDNDKWLCGLGFSRPFGCCASTPTADYCTVRFQPAPRSSQVPDEG